MNTDKEIQRLKREIFHNDFNDTNQLKYLARLLERSGQDHPEEETVEIGDLKIRKFDGGYVIDLKDHSDMIGEGLILLDYFDDETGHFNRQSPTLYVWSDIEKEDATHRIDLSEAHENES